MTPAEAFYHKFKELAREYAEHLRSTQDSGPESDLSFEALMGVKKRIWDHLNLYPRHSNDPLSVKLAREVLDQMGSKDEFLSVMLDWSNHGEMREQATFVFNLMKGIEKVLDQER